MTLTFSVSRDGFEGLALTWARGALTTGGILVGYAVMLRHSPMYTVYLYT